MSHTIDSESHSIRANWNVIGLNQTAFKKSEQKLILSFFCSNAKRRMEWLFFAACFHYVILVSSLEPF